MKNKTVSYRLFIYILYIYYFNVSVQQCLRNNKIVSKIIEKIQESSTKFSEVDFIIVCKTDI